MDGILTFALLGLGLGGAYAIAATGVVLVYRGSGVVNFAHVGMSVVAAFAYADLKTLGWPTWAAIVTALASSGLIGLLTHFLIMQRMQRASTLSRVVATLGILTVIQSAAGLLHGDGISLLPSLLPNDPVHIVGNTLGADRLYLVGISALLCVALWAVYRFTRFGQLTTAVAENQRAVAALGRSPETIAMANWVLGSVLSGLAGILLAPIVGLSVSQIGTLLIPPLAAALLGGFSSFGLTWIGAIAIGIAQSEITRYVSAPGWSSAVPILLVIAVLLVRGRKIPERGAVQDRLPAVGGGSIRPAVAIGALGVLAVLIFTVNDNWLAAITTALIVGLICLSLTVLTGYAGQLSLAQFALAGCAALVAARLSAAWGVPFVPAALLAIIVTTVAGMVIALPALRIRGVTLGIVTLGIAVVVQQVILGNPDYTGGVLGTTVQSPDLFGWSIDATAHPERYAAVCAVFLTLVAIAVSNLRRGQTGRLMLAVRGNERAAASLGLSVTHVKLYAFGVSSVLAAAAGVLLAFQSPNVTFDGYTAQSSIDVVGVTVIGGLGFIGGALTGAVSTGGGPIAHLLDGLTGSQHTMTLITGVLMLVTLATAPNGMFALTVGQIHAVARRFGRRPSSLPTRPPEATPTKSSAAYRAKPRSLSVTGLSVSFGGTHALRDVSIDVRPGEVVGVIGPNGAGKTTLIDAISGLTRLNAGHIQLDGKPIGRWSTQARARRGLVRSFQSLELFDDLTVADQLRVSDRSNRFAWILDLVRVRQSPLTPVIASVVHEFGLEPLLHRSPNELTYGQRRLLAIARALAAQPSILLLDEPAAGLDENERIELGALLSRLAHESGLGILLVEHDVALVASASDRIVALDFGQVIASGTPDEVLRHPEVLVAYLGGESSCTDTELATQKEGRA